MKIKKCSCGCDPNVASYYKKPSNELVHCWVWCSHCLLEGPKRTSRADAITAWNKMLRKGNNK